MSNRFLHDSFTLTVPCAHCDGEQEFKVEGHFDDHENFRIHSVVNLHTNKEVIPTEAQAEKIDDKAAERYPEVMQENILHAQEL